MEFITTASQFKLFYVFPLKENYVRTYMQSVKVLRVPSRETFTCIFSTNKLCKSCQKLIKISGVEENTCV